MAVALTPDSAHELLIDRALGRVIRIMQRLRFVGSTLLALIGTVFVVHHEAPWKIVLAFTTSATLLMVSVRDLRRRKPRLDHADTVRTLATVLTAQLIAVTLTGGIRSPLLLVVPPFIVAIAIGTGRIDLFKPVGLVLATAIIVLALGDLLAWWPPEALVPWVLRRFDDQLAVGYVAVAGWAFASISVVSVVVGINLRRAFRVALEQSTAARAEVLEAMRLKNRELEALAGALAHELKNPLASISGLAGLLARKLPEQSKEAERMDVLLGEVKRMSQILDEFLNFSRPSEGLAASDVAADTLVADVMALHEGEAVHKRVHLVSDLQSHRMLHADPRKLKQVLINLVQNALEVSPVDATVTVRVRDTDSGVAFEIDDEGGGLAPAILDRLFTAGATTKPAGTGLGLVIARGITEQHGGTLTLVNHGKGCRARVTLGGLSQ